MRLLKKTALLAGTVGLALTAFAPAQAAGKHLTILFSIPQMAFPFFVHMTDAAKAEAAKLGDVDLVVSDGQGSSPKQTSDVEAGIAKKVDGIVISPNEV